MNFFCSVPPRTAGHPRVALAALACMLLGMAAARVSAHDTWLAAEQRVVRAGADLDLLMTSGERFPDLGTVIAPQRIETSACRQGSKAIAFKPGRREPRALRLSASMPSNNNVTCWVQLKPRTLELDAPTVAHYLDEIDAPAAVRDAWAAARPPKRWSETYTKNAKVIVPGVAASGSPRPDAPVGLKLELILGTGAGVDVKDGTLPVVALLDGKPRAGLSIALTGEQGGTSGRRRSDAQGRVVFPWPQPGRWMLSATDLVARDEGKGEWESQFSTLVFELPPASR